MTLSEKLISITENIPKVYEAGKESMVDKNKIVENSASGNPIFVKDVSEIPHLIQARLTSDTTTDYSNITVSRCGKNLFDISKIITYKSPSGSVINNGDGTITIVLTDVATSAKGNTPNKLGDYAPFLKVGQKYTLSATTTGSNKYIYLSTAKESWYFGESKTITEDILNSPVLWYASGFSTTAIIGNLQIEPGTSATEYESFVGKTYNASEDGTVDGIQSLSPYMTITSSANVDISIIYHKSWGMKNQYDMFWDTYQQNGKRTDYNCAFGGTGWNNDTFKPKYDLKPEASAYCMFRDTEIKGDLEELLKQNGVVLDTSNTTSFTSMFQLAEKITRIGVLDCRKSASSMDSLFADAKKLKTIDKLCLTENSRLASGTFRNMLALENITIDGYIGISFNFNQSPLLSPDSIESIITHLSSNVSGQTVSFASGAIDNYIAVKGSDMWHNLNALFPNWTFATI